MIKVGQKVQINCTCTLDDGTVIAVGERAGEPFDFIVGSELLPHGVSRALSEMQVGERRQVRLEPSEAYGEYDPSFVETIPVDAIPNGDKLPVGGYVTFSTPMGPVRVKIAKIENGQVTFDHNHELAGRTLTYDLELLYIYGESGTLIENEQYAGGGCGCGCDILKEAIGGCCHDHDHGHGHDHDHSHAHVPA